jgi:hypothetical protein
MTPSPSLISSTFALPSRAASAALSAALTIPRPSDPLDSCQNHMPWRVHNSLNEWYQEIAAETSARSARLMILLAALRSSMWQIATQARHALRQPARRTEL